MANLVITSTAYTVKVEFNDASVRTKIKVSSYRRDEVSEIIEDYNSDHLKIIMLDGQDFDLSYTTHKYALPVDSVDGVVPTDNNHLFTLLEALQQV